MEIEEIPIKEPEIQVVDVTEDSGCSENIEIPGGVGGNPSEWGKKFLQEVTRENRTPKYPQNSNQWYQGDIYRGTFEGFGISWMLHGEGIFNYKNGDVYNGQWKNGKPHGVGTYSEMYFKIEKILLRKK